MKKLGFLFAAVIVATSAFSQAAFAREFFIGGPVHKYDMEIVANYLVGIEMSPMTKGMVHGPNAVHVEADVHATADNKMGYPDGAWIAYLTIRYKLEKIGTTWKSEGVLKPMIAADGPHYADNVMMNGPGTYRLTYMFYSPENNGFYRHTDRATGVPAWWPPFAQVFTFKYPQN
jgi:uncharacterized protein involved in high-affinity Fe2+ transport